MLERLRFKLAWFLIGTIERQTVEAQAQELYEEIWPKHDHYKEQTLHSIRVALIRSRTSYFGF
jgi:hypothetical protein